jgi:putative DNA primase/helicase
MPSTERRFLVGVCQLYPGRKLRHGDPRWGQHTRNFHTQSHTLDSFAEAVTVRGYAFSAVMKNSYRLNANFMSSSVLSLDFHTEDERSSLESLAADPFIRDHGAFLYETPSSTPKKPRGRAVFILDTPITDAGQYSEACKALIWKYQGIADATEDAARFYYGRPSAPRNVLGHVLYGDVLQAEVLEPYLKAQTNSQRKPRGELGDVIPEKQRNKTLASYAGRLRRDGLNQVELEAALLAINASRCVPPLPDVEVISIAKSVSRYPPADSSSPQDAEAALPTLTVTNILDIKTRPVEWLWKGRIPLRKHTIIAGDPGLGKSFCTLDIAARVSHSGPWPDGGNAPQGNVLIISAEDDADDTIKPRLEEMGANLANIDIISTTVQHGEKVAYLSLADHLLQLEEAIIEHQAVLLILDPILAFTGKGTDTHRSSDVRAVLAPLSSMASRTECAVLSVLHLNKRSAELNSIYRLTASLDFVAAARSVLAVGKHPDEPETRRVLAAVKSNLAAMPPSLGFHIRDGFFTWEGEVDLDANTLLSSPVNSAEERGRLEEAKGFLEEVLRGGAVKANELFAEARGAGIAEKTLRRAKDELGVVVARVTQGNQGQGYWTWGLPQGVQPQVLQGGQDLPCEKVGHLTKFGHLTNSQAQNGPPDPPPGGVQNHKMAILTSTGGRPSYDGEAEVEDEVEAY